MNANQAASTDTSRLTVRGLSKRYGSVQALDRVDFDLRPGEIMALLGENGAGKSTLVKVLAGLVDPDEGTIEIDGAPVTLYPSAQSQAAGVAVVHQEYSSVPTMTVAENLVLGQSGVSPLWLPGSLNRRARELLKQVGLDDLDPRTPVEQLTVAETQLLEIARLLVRDARILIFDEPTAALTDREIERVLRRHPPARDRGPQRDLRDAPPRGGVPPHRPRDRVPQRAEPPDPSRRPSSTSTASSTGCSAASCRRCSRRATR